MYIDISKVYGELMHVALRSGHREFIGNLFAERFDDRIEVYDFVLLQIGSGGYSEIDPMDMIPLIVRKDAKNMKGFVHKHPVGDGIPGEHNWSATDRACIFETPLGSLPKIVKWSFSVVLTPGGWVGRIDNYVTGKTLHCPVIGVDSDFAQRTENTLAKRLMVENPAEYYGKDDDMPEITNEDWISIQDAQIQDLEEEIAALQDDNRRLRWRLLRAEGNGLRMLDDDFDEPDPYEEQIEELLEDERDFQR